MLLYTLEFDMIPSHVTHPFALEFLSSYLMNTNNLEWMLMRYWFQLEWTYDSTTIFAPSFLILGIHLIIQCNLCAIQKKGLHFITFAVSLKLHCPQIEKLEGIKGLLSTRRNRHLFRVFRYFVRVLKFLSFYKKPTIVRWRRL